MLHCRAGNRAGAGIFYGQWLHKSRCSGRSDVCDGGRVSRSIFAVTAANLVDFLVLASRCGLRVFLCVTLEDARVDEVEGIVHPLGLKNRYAGASLRAAIGSANAQRS